MDIFGKFASREELLGAVEEAILCEKETVGAEGGAPREEECFFLKNDAAAAADEIRARYEAQRGEAKELRARLAEAESRADRLAKENARLTATNEEFSNYNPEKQRDEINRLLEEVGRLKADNRGLNEQIEPLNRLIADYKRKEDERTIDKALIDEATALGADRVSVEGTLDPAAESYALRWRTDAAPNDVDQIALTGPAESVFPVVVTGLVPETTYRFEIVSAGARGESVSAAVSATTPAAPQLAVPTFEIFDADAAGVKRAEIADVAGAAYFELQIAAGDGFSGAETLRVTNSGGARVFLRDWPESESGTYSVRVRAASGSNAYSDSAWSEAAAVEIGPGEGGDAESAAEMAVYSNLAIYAAPSAPYHAATVSKVSELISGAVGAVVNTVGGLSGTVTCAQLASAAAEEGVLVVHSTGAAPNPNNTPVITASSTDAQVPSAKAVYYYVQNVRGRLAASLAEHQHTFLCAWGSERIVAAPALDEDGTIVPDAALAPAFDAGETYLPDAVVASEGYLYRNTSGTASTGNADFARKWTKTTAAELIARAAQSAGGRYTADFFGADLDEERSIEITHNLGERYVSVELIDMTAGAGAPVIGALVSLTSDDALKLTFSEGLPAAGRYKAVVRV
ncbi:MAG: hypothetical protein IK105_09495 [Thermoguttaceae bacterium]|nr:hypothetical protein [Thermoguttaceae bacterium]